MAANDQNSPSPSKRSARLRMAGIIVLALGIGGAGLVYWLGNRSPDLTDDLSMLGFNKAESRQMGLLYGKQGLLIEEWSEDLRRPGTQATLILVGAALGAIGCFYFARLLEDDSESR